MSNIKKLMMTAASGDAFLNVEDVFSTYLYEANMGGQNINNGIKLVDGDTDAVEFTTPGTYSWTCPDGVTSVDVVCVGGGGAYNGGGGGGGGLGYKNNISVTAGNTYTVRVGEGGKADYSNTQPTDCDSYFISTSTVKGGGGNYSSGGTYTGDGGGNGGTGGNFRAGGGAGGYSGNGGDCAPNYGNGSAGSGGGGGGGGQGIGGGYVQLAAGGGVGIYGQGSNGAGGTGGTTVQAGGGGGGSGGYSGSDSNGSFAPNGGLYGGGGGTAYIGGTQTSADGNGGAVRIVYRSSSSFPSTNVGFTANGEGEGGLAWFKSRSHATSHLLFDTARGEDERLMSNSTSNQDTQAAGRYPEFTGSGFILTKDGGGDINYADREYASWTWRKAPKFFDIQTWTGNGTSGRTINHDLGSTPGCVIIKRTDGTQYWEVYHRGTTSGKKLVLNTTGAEANGSDITAVSDTTITLSNSYTVNGATNANYVAYIFAHNDGDGGFGPNGDQDIIKCGSFDSDPSSGTTPVDVDLGFEPQFFMWKPISGANPTGDWVVYDTMRGFVNATSGNGDARLRWNTSGAEQAYNNTGHPTATGVTMKTGAYGTKYVYIAIRRGPMAIPTQATDVFNVLKETSRNLNENPPYLQKTNWPVDVVTNRVFDTGSNWWTGNRLTHSRTQLDSPAAQTGTNTTHFWDYNNGVAVKGLTPASNFMGYHFRRAPHFFDVACYTGTGTAGLTVNHSLGVEPEMIWVKNRTSSSENWSSYWQSLGNTKILFLNKTFQALANSNYWNSTTPTDTQFTLGNYPSTNNSGDEFVAYLFASVDGVSKVGSYTGNGTSQTIDCGFTNGARYVLFKRTDASYEFVLFDSERGIVAGNDPFMTLADANGQNSNFDAVDPNSSGFTVTGNWEGNNYSGSSYVFYAIA